MGGHRTFRRRLPDERKAIGNKFSVAGVEGYLHAGMFPDGTVGELFLNVSRQGSTVRGLCDAVAVLVSLCLQYNVPLDVLIEKLEDMRFEPSGRSTGNEAISEVGSILDYVAKWLKLKFAENNDEANRFAQGQPIAEREPKPEPLPAEEERADAAMQPRPRRESSNGHTRANGKPPEPTTPK